ncbi:MAG: Ig-like domain-containing protein [Balneolaceae bacterium]|nr:Ig-like domain-containing protein [Balneolaceae bacterium]MCH8549382.1 Ig-like domain-containing protein [Balneolaceae bacterium]
MTKRYTLSLWLLFGFATALLLYSCATPVAPTGGPPDRQGPTVIGTSPQNGTTNFDGTEVTFRFDQFVDRNSFRQNVSIEPDLAIDFDISFSRRSATVSFESPLPENTTIVVKVGVDVTDTNNNKMDSSFDLALSTGDVLDDGEVTGRLIKADTGERESGMRVFLYREPVDLNERARYVAQTDTSGTFNFGYLSEGTYKAFWVDDLNRNRRWDRERERAQPFMQEKFELGRGDTFDLGTLYYTRPDTVSPRIDGVGLLSERRLRLRLSEEVVWDSDSRIAVTDTLGNEFTMAYPLYSPIEDPNVLFAQTDDALPEDQIFTLSPSGITDEAGNRLRIDFSPFTGSAQEDTTGLRTVSHNSGSGLFPDEPLEIKYTKFIDDDSIVDSLQVFEGDQQFNEWEAVEIDRHILRILPRNERWESGLRYEFRVWNPWESDRERINPDIWQRNQLGGIEFEVINTDPQVPKRLRVTDLDNSILVDTTFTGTSIEIDNLPPLEYKARIFEDLNGDGEWNAGRIDPYVKPEPYAIMRRIPVREGFTSEVELTFPPRLIEVDPDAVPEPEMPEQVEPPDQE